MIQIDAFRLFLAFLTHRAPENSKMAEIMNYYRSNGFPGTLCGVACEPTPACVVEIATPDQPASGEEVVSEAPPSYDKLQTKAKHLHTYV